MRVGNKVSMGEEEATPHRRKLHSLTIPPFAMSMVTFNTKKNYLFFKKNGIRTGSSLSSALAKKEITHKVGNRKILSKRLIFNRSATCQKSEIRLLFLLPAPRSGEKNWVKFPLLIWVMSQTSGQNTVKEGGNMTDIP